MSACVNVSLKVPSTAQLRLTSGWILSLLMQLHTCCTSNLRIQQISTV